MIEDQGKMNRSEQITSKETEDTKETLAYAGKAEDVVQASASFGEVANMMKEISGKWGGDKESLMDLKDKLIAEDARAYSLLQKDLPQDIAMRNIMGIEQYSEYINNIKKSDKPKDIYRLMQGLAGPAKTVASAFELIRNSLHFTSTKEKGMPEDEQKRETAMKVKDIMAARYKFMSVGVQAESLMKGSDLGAESDKNGIINAYREGYNLLSKGGNDVSYLGVEDVSNHIRNLKNAKTPKEMKKIVKELLPGLRVFQSTMDTVFNTFHTASPYR